MNTHLLHLHSFPRLILQLITFWVFLSFPLCLAGNLEWYDNCGSYFSCGNVSKVGFPFWSTGSRSKNCGYAGLELGCEGNATITLGMMGMKYRVLDINQNTQTLKIAREDLWEGICLQKFINTTLDFELFDYAYGLQNITVLYGCPPPYVSVAGQFTCRLNNGVNETTAYPELGILGPSGCYASVVVPVPEPLSEQIGNISLIQIIKHGFLVKYKVQNQCLECEKSRGRCGFDLNDNKTTCLCPDGSVGYTTCNTTKTAAYAPPQGSTKYKAKIAGTIFLALFAAIGSGMLLFSVAFCFERRLSNEDNEAFLENWSGLLPFAVAFCFKRRLSNKDIEAFLKNYGSSTARRYTYKDLKKITNSFRKRLGEGGYGAVYKRKLPNGNLVAVKLLKKSTGNAEEFINEVASIGKTNHLNIVKLMGFCFEGHKRALIYDFMPNGSLDKYIYGGASSEPSLALEDLFRIAVGIARGLEYLHQGCNTRILHFDIKPHNILLDENYSPKISDFGLAKNCMQRDSIISMSGARGTIGYIAPEVFLKNFGGVSYKSDVYSYGILVLEMLGCRENGNAKAECSSEQYFPHRIYNQLERGEELNHEEMMNGEERVLQKKMVMVGLWCIQPSPSSRPTMTRVVEMLEGSLESLQIPPMPSLATPPRSQQDSSTALTLSTSTTPPPTADPTTAHSMEIEMYTTLP